MTLKKDLLKLMNNSVFDKTMENLRKELLLNWLTAKKKMLRLAREPNFEEKCVYNREVDKNGFEILTDEKTGVRYKMIRVVAEPSCKEVELFGVLMSPEKIMMDKPIYVGAAILDLSKTVMYEFRYDYMMPKYGIDRATLLYMDTDSLIYHIKADDFYEDIADDIEARFDNSAYKGKYCRMKTGLNKKSHRFDER